MTLMDLSKDLHVRLYMLQVLNTKSSKFGPYMTRSYLATELFDYHKVVLRFTGKVAIGSLCVAAVLT